MSDQLNFFNQRNSNERVESTVDGFRVSIYLLFSLTAETTNLSSNKNDTSKINKKMSVILPEIPIDVADLAKKEWTNPQTYFENMATPIGRTNRKESVACGNRRNQSILLYRWIERYDAGVECTTIHHE